MKTIVLSNGSAKSGFITSLAIKEFGPDNTRVLLINENQSAFHQQHKAVQRQADYYNIPYTVITHGPLAGGLFRITAMLLTASSLAVNLGYNRIYYGVCKSSKGDEFNYEQTYTHLRNMQMIMKSARIEKIRSNFPEPEAPSILLTYSQVVALAHKYDTPINMTWNCDTGNLTPCGICMACVKWKSAQTAKAYVGKKPTKGQIDQSNLDRIPVYRVAT